MNQKYILAAIVASTALCACGGGGGGTDLAASTPPVVVTPPPPTPPVVVAAPYTITPSILQATNVAGYPATVTLNAKQTVAFTGVVFIKASVDAAVIDSAIVITPQPDSSATFLVKTSATAPVGHYTGNITINVCLDANCVNSLPGSPFKLPYDINVVSPDGNVATQNLSSLSPLVGASDWSTYQGNAQHTGYVPATLTASAFNLRWIWAPPASAGVLLQPSTIATGGGMFFLSTGTSFTAKGSNFVAAYSEKDGSKVWSHSFDDLTFSSTNPPAFDNGKVYISAGSQNATSMFGFDAATGAQVFKSAMSSQWEHYLAPTIFNGNVFNDGGTYGGLYSFNETSGGLNYFTNLQQYDGWTPAVDAQNLYAYVGGALQLIDPATGVSRGAINDPNYSWNGYTTGGAPVIGANGLVLAGNLSNAASNAIVGFDVLANNVRWSAVGAYSGNPAYADGIVFASNNVTAALEARKDSDGTLIWSWAAPANDHHFISDVLVTKNLVFVSTNMTTYAINRTTHSSVWSYAAAGRLAMSANGILYIKSDTTITAINLK